VSTVWWKALKISKEAKSPAALERKRKYETQYESSPARKKYRRELERERRKRGVAGKGGKDMSHTKTGKIVPEDPHTNRARSHPSVGSTLKMVVVKAPQTRLFVQGQKNLYGQPTFLPTDFDAMQKRREAELKRLKEREAREEQRRKNAIGLTPLPLENPE
tara:strand:+ start:513 stop:995 length:483 start_codon:yes stop_codon:yes gene_type:complete